MKFRLDLLASKRKVRSAVHKQKLVLGFLHVFPPGSVFLNFRLFHCPVSGFGYAAVLGTTYRCGYKLESRLATEIGEPFTIGLRYDIRQVSESSALLAVYDSEKNPLILLDSYQAGLNVFVRSSSKDSWSSRSQGFLYVFQTNVFVQLIVKERSFRLDVDGWIVSIALDTPVQAKFVAFGLFQPVPEVVVLRGKTPQPFCGYMSELYVNNRDILNGYPLENDNEVVQGDALPGRLDLNTFPFYLENLPVTVPVDPPTGNTSVFFKFRVAKTSRSPLLIAAATSSPPLILEVTEHGDLVVRRPVLRSEHQLAFTNSLLANFSDGVWHSVMVFINVMFVQIIVDGQRSQRIFFTSSMGDVSQVVLGGPGFVGCLSAISINLQDVNLQPLDESSSQYTKSCPDCVRRGLCSNRGYCHKVLGNGSYQCKCEQAGFGGDHCHLPVTTQLPIRTSSTPSSQSTRDQALGTSKDGDASPTGMDSTNVKIRKSKQTDSRWYNPWLYVTIGGLLALLCIFLLVAYVVTKYRNRYTGRFYPQYFF